LLFKYLLGTILVQQHEGKQHSFNVRNNHKLKKQGTLKSAPYG